MGDTSEAVRWRRRCEERTEELRRVVPWARLAAQMTLDADPDGPAGAQAAEILEWLDVLYVAERHLAPVDDAAVARRAS